MFRFFCNLICYKVAKQYCKAIVWKKNYLTENVSFKEFKEAELLLFKEDQFIFKERKYEFIDLFDSLNSIEDNDGLLKVKERSTRKFYVAVANIVE